MARAVAVLAGAERVARCLRTIGVGEAVCMARTRENVWDYPRPPRLERFDGTVDIVHAGVEIARGAWAWRVLETTHPPVYYLPPEQLTRAGRDALRRADRPRTGCEWKGLATYWDLAVPGAAVVDGAAWSYEDPVPRFAELRDALAFYPSKVDRCTVDGEVVRAQDGDFYGGWITSWIDGGKKGFKGGPGTWGW